MYQAKTVLPGYKIRLKTPDLYVAIPKHSWGKWGVEVKYKGEIKHFFPKQIATEQTFDDKFGRGEYTLTYCLWSKNAQKSI